MGGGAEETWRFTFDHSILRWDEGIPLGNGLMGCLVWGKPDELCLSLDRGDIWDVTAPPGTDSPDFTYRNLVDLARKKDMARIREIYDAPYYCPVPTKLPVGRIVLRIPSGTDVRSCLRLRAALADLKVATGEGEVGIRGFVHAAGRFGIFHIGRRAAGMKIELENPGFGRIGEEDHYRYSQRDRQISQGDLKSIKYEDPRKGSKDLGDGARLLYYVQKVSGDFSYGVVAGIRESGEGTRLSFVVASSHDGENWLEDAFSEAQGVLAQEFDRLLAEHRAWWENFWEESSISLPEKEFERQWHMSNYLMASCSKKGCWPMPLQGVWTAAEEALPPWKGDYHNDLNTQMSYYSYLKANHLGQGECFLDFLWDKREQAAEFARKFYGTGGLCLPSVMTIDAQPLGGWPMYSLSPTNQIWLGWGFEQYYRFTGDQTFLEERAYPYLRGIAECITGLLEQGQDGFFYLPVSSSPEIHDDTAEAFVTPNSNYDLALMRYLFETLIRFSLHLQDGRDGEYRDVLARLPELSVDEKYVLMVSPDEHLTESHRHFSNAMAVHPLRLIGYEKEGDRRIVDAVVEDFERLGTGNWTGFSFCWMAELYAVQKNGEGAAKMLSIFWKYFCSPNGFHLNGDYTRRGYSHFTYRPFTLEANMCAADALQEMLFYMRDGRMELFPAIPEDWERKEISFSKLRGEKGILVSARLAGGKLMDVRIFSPAEDEIMVAGWDMGGERAERENWVWPLKAGENRRF